VIVRMEKLPLRLHTGKVAMNTPVIAVIIVVASWQYALNPEQGLQERLSRLVRTNFHPAASF